MKNNIATLCTLALLLSGCISTKTYVDPTFSRTQYSTLKHPEQPLALKVTAHFFRNGAPMPRADGEVLGHVERTLRGSGLVTPSDAGSDGTITVNVTNVADLGAAAGKGLGTGMTFGLVGTTVEDGYEMSVVLTVNGKTITKDGYKHRLVSTVGHTPGPPGLEPTTSAAGFGVVVEQMLLNALGDLQAQGLLAQTMSQTLAPTLAGAVPNDPVQLHWETASL